MDYEPEIDESKLEARAEHGGKLEARCPACAELGGDKGGNHFFMSRSTGKWGCARFAGDAEHRKRIFALVGKLTKTLSADAKRKLPPVQQKCVATYDYTDPFGNIRFRVRRYEPGKGGDGKEFFQQHKDEQGNWQWGIKGIERCIYNWPAVIKAEEVWIVEGEGKADVLNKLGYCATTCVCGSGKWHDAYSKELAGKRVVLCPDNDEPGQEHATKVHESLVGVCDSLLRVKVPAPHNDIKDYLPTLATDEEKIMAITKMMDKGVEYSRGIDTPIRTMEQLERDYVQFIAKSRDYTLNLTNWLPSMKYDVRPVRPGDVIVFLAGTGVGKTILLQNIAMNAWPLNVLMFELELPGVVTFERFAAMATKKWPDAIEQDYEQGKPANWQQAQQLRRVYVSSKAGVTLDEIRAIYRQCELISTVPPPLVLLDYIQLIKGVGGSRYEKVSNIAEDLKTLAKDLNVILVVASQVHRETGEDQEVFLHDAKDSGSIENSAGLVFGVWHPNTEDDDTRIDIRMLKQNKGRRRMKNPIQCKIFEGLIVKELTNEPKEQK